MFKSTARSAAGRLSDLTSSDAVRITWSAIGVLSINPAHHIRILVCPTNSKITSAKISHHCCAVEQWSRHRCVASAELPGTRARWERPLWSLIFGGESQASGFRDAYDGHRHHLSTGPRLLSREHRQPTIDDQRSCLRRRAIRAEVSLRYAVA